MGFSNSAGGKGSGRRKALVSSDIVDANFERIFGKKDFYQSSEKQESLLNTNLDKVNPLHLPREGDIDIRFEDGKENYYVFQNGRWESMTQIYFYPPALPKDGDTYKTVDGSTFVLESGLWKACRE